MNEVAINTHIDLRHLNVPKTHTATKRPAAKTVTKLRTSLELIGDAQRDCQFTFRNVIHVPVMSL